MRNYNDLSDAEKHLLLTKYYLDELKSIQEIALMYNLYPNKVRRDLKKFNIPVRSKSEAQKLALESGKHKHPTKGTQRSVETKEKIGASVMNSWEKISDSELQKRKDVARDNWDKLPDHKKQEILSAANVAVRESSKTGSKLERFLLEALLSSNHKVKFHQKILLDTDLEFDLFLPASNIVIEVDGPSHFEPVWGEQNLKRMKTYDNKKTGLIIGKGLKLIRIKQTKDFSNARAEIVLKKLLKGIDTLVNSKSTFLEIGDE